MTINKTLILERICYTDLVYDRINKKLNCRLSRNEIEKLLADIISETSIDFFLRKGKNIYVSNAKRNVSITINSSTFRVITVDKIAF